MTSEKTTIERMEDISLLGQILTILFAPLALVMYVVLTPLVIIWTGAGVILSAVTGRNWCRLFGDPPRVK